MDGRQEPAPHLSHYPTPPSGGGNEDEGYLHWYWSFLIIRGTAWQIDTLPTPLAETNIIYPTLPEMSPIQ